MSTWTIWVGETSRTLHAADGGRTRGMVTAVCGMHGYSTSEKPLPGGTFTHCQKCRSMLGE